MWIQELGEQIGAILAEFRKRIPAWKPGKTGHLTNVCSSGRQNYYSRNKKFHRLVYTELSFRARTALGRCLTCQCFLPWKLDLMKKGNAFWRNRVWVFEMLNQSVQICLGNCSRRLGETGSIWRPLVGFLSTLIFGESKPHFTSFRLNKIA